MGEPAVTVAGLLHSRPEAIGLPLELLSGENGLERKITSPHIQKTGLALTGFDEYLRPARILVFGESEVRYLESLPSETRLTTLAAVFAHEIPCVLITGWEPPADSVGVRPPRRPCFAPSNSDPIAKVTAVRRSARGARGHSLL